MGKSKNLILLAVGTLSAACFAHAKPAYALPEAMLATHTGGVIAQAILNAKGDLTPVLQQFSKTGIPVLDQLWDSRTDFTEGACNKKENDCRVLSVFQGKTNDHPVVMLPGFTGYRKMFIEDIYDMIQQGYGPIYISDYTGTGDSFKEELKPGQPAPTIADYLKRYSNQGVQKLYMDQVIQATNPTDAPKIASALEQLPFGVGYIKHFKDYYADIDFIMAKAVADNPDKPIFIDSLSMSGLTLLHWLALQDKNPTWISHIDRILLQSPMVRIKATDTLIPGFGLLSDFAIGLGEALFGRTSVLKPKDGITSVVDKATGHYNPQNVVSHSSNRVTFTDAVRMWNGHETAGATFGWGYQELTYQYAEDGLDVVPLGAHPLNHCTAAIADVLNTYGIQLITVASAADPLVNEPSTEKFLHDLAKAGGNTEFCKFQTAKHQIDIEMDKYRDPFMALIGDQKDHVIKSSYGDPSVDEPLVCQSVGS